MANQNLLLMDICSLRVNWDFDMATLYPISTVMDVRSAMLTRRVSDRRRIRIGRRSRSGACRSAAGNSRARCPPDRRTPGLKQEGKPIHTCRQLWFGDLSNV